MKTRILIGLLILSLVFVMGFAPMFTGVKRFALGVDGSTAGGGGGAAGTTWDPLAKSSNVVLTGDNLIASSSVSSVFGTVLSTTSHSTGKYYFEITLVNGGYVANHTVGVQTTTHSLNKYIGDDAHGWGYQANGRFYLAGILSSGYPTYSGGGVVQVAVDLDNHKLWFGLNNTWNGDPAAGTGEASATLDDAEIFAAASPYHAEGTLTGAFTSADMTYTPPIGFTAWGD